MKKFKPHPDTYQHVIDYFGVSPEKIMMVAAHAWDLAGAKNVGLKTTFVARKSNVLYPNLPSPDNVVKDLSELVASLERQ